MLIQTEFPYPSANLRIPIKDKNIWIIITLKKNHVSKNSISVIKKYLPERKREDFIFRSTHYHYTRKPLSIYQYSRIVKNWLRDLGVEDVSEYSTHSIRKTKSSVIYDRTKNVDAVRRLLGQSSVTATSAYLGISDESALDLARTINI